MGYTAHEDRKNRTSNPAVRMQGTMDFELHYRGDNSFKASGKYTGTGGLHLGGRTQLSFDALLMEAECGDKRTPYAQLTRVCDGNPTYSTYGAELTLSPFEKPFSVSAARFSFNTKGHLSVTARASTEQYASAVFAQMDCAQVIDALCHMPYVAATRLM